MTSPKPPVLDHGAHSAPTNTTFIAFGLLSPLDDVGGSGSEVPGGGEGDAGDSLSLGIGSGSFGGAVAFTTRAGVRGAVFVAGALVVWLVACSETLGAWEEDEAEGGAGGDDAPPTIVPAPLPPSLWRNDRCSLRLASNCTGLGEEMQDAIILYTHLLRFADHSPSTTNLGQELFVLIPGTVLIRTARSIARTGPQPQPPCGP